MKIDLVTTEPGTERVKHKSLVLQSEHTAYYHRALCSEPGTTELRTTESGTAEPAARHPRAP